MNSLDRTCLENLVDNDKTAKKWWKVHIHCLSMRIH